MKTIAFLVSFLLFACSCDALTWSLYSGNYTNINKFGTTSYPGCRYQGNIAVLNGEVYLLSGIIGVSQGGHPSPYSDLWAFNDTWLWISPDYGQYNQNQDQGDCEPFDSTNFPSNMVAPSVLVTNNLLFLFGGATYIGFGNNVLQYLGDLWTYNYNTTEWAVVSSPPGQECDANPTNVAGYPPARYAAASWTRNDTLFYFGGKGQSGVMGDFWTYSGYGWILLNHTLSPPARYLASTWVDEEGNFWMYGGLDASNNTFSDMWKFSVSNCWTEIISECGPGPRESAFTWSYNDSLVLYGGTMDPTASQLWVFHVSMEEWHTISLSGTPRPDARIGGSAWRTTDALYLFGGRDVNGTHNDVWKANL
jgi:hypothetical protein